MLDEALTEKEKKLLREVAKAIRMQGQLMVDLRPCGDAVGMSEPLTEQTAWSLATKDYIEPFPRSVWITTLKAKGNGFIAAEQAQRELEMARDLLIAVGKKAGFDPFKAVEVLPLGQSLGYSTAETILLAEHHVSAGVGNLTWAEPNGPHRTVRLTDDGLDRALKAYVARKAEQARGFLPFVKRIWSDPVWSKVIASGITALIAAFVTWLFLRQPTK